MNTLTDKDASTGVTLPDTDTPADSKESGTTGGEGAQAQEVAGGQRKEQKKRGARR